MLKQEDCKFKANRVCIVKSCLKTHTHIYAYLSLFIRGGRELLFKHDYIGSSIVNDLWIKQGEIYRV
jgi:hypothetical protein